MKRIALLQVGYGTVGGAVIQQVIAHHQRWHDALGLDVRIAAIAGRDGAVALEQGAPLTDDTLRAVVERRARGESLPAIVPLLEMRAMIGEADVVIVMDAAAGTATTDLLVDAVQSGAGAVLSNKAPLALPADDPRSDVLWAAARSGGPLRYEATCGAGLPIISTLRTLLDTGDRVRSITGALSGTFGAIFSMVAESMAFSEAVRTAKERGYTEPDPRDDLSGLDVARKALILSRTIGRRVDLTDIGVQSLVPDQLAKVDIPTFLDDLDVSDAEIRALGRQAVDERAALKYVASIEADGGITVGLQQIPRSTVLGALQGPENIVSIRTERYDDYPTVVSGPGAGAAVTAAGMLGDALALSRHLPHGPALTNPGGNVRPGLVH